MNFRVGQKVVCVDDAEDFPDVEGIDWRPLEIKKGNIYVVRWCGPHTDNILGTEICVRLVGFVRPDDDYDDLPFRASRFRPIVERETDISVFTRMLTPTPTKVN